MIDDEEKRVAFEELTTTEVAGFLDWVQRTQDSDGLRLKVEDRVWLVHAEPLPTCAADGCDYNVNRDGGYCLEHGSRKDAEAGEG